MVGQHGVGEEGGSGGWDVKGVPCRHEGPGLGGKVADQPGQQAGGELHVVIQAERVVAGPHARLDPGQQTA